MPDLNTILIPAEKLADGTFSKPMKASDIIEKAKTSTLTRAEMAALRKVGLRKDGSPVATRAPVDPTAVTSEKLLNAAQVFGASATIQAAYDKLNADADKLADLNTAVRKMVRRLRADKSESLGEAIETATRLGLLSSARSGLGGYSVSKAKRAVINVGDLALVFNADGSVASRVSQTTIEHNGVKGVFVTLATDEEIAAGSDDDEDDGEDEAEGQPGLFG